MVDKYLIDALRSQNITTFTPIQTEVIDRVLTGGNLMIRSQTGSGKTLAYLLPMIQILNRDEDGSQMLVLVPTRELAKQVAKVVESLGCELPMAVIYGGVDYAPQIDMIANAPRIIISTPGRLQDLIFQGFNPLNLLRYFILDEADKMVDMGFREPILSLAKYRCDGAKTLCVSATSSDDIEAVLGVDFEVVEGDGEPLAAQSIDQSAYYVEQSMMDQLLIYLLRSKPPERSIVFCRSRKMADRLGELLVSGGFSAEVMHSDRSQGVREHIIKRFVRGESSILVATDLVARGIDVEGVTHVFNFGMPQTTEDYIHRIGRTGRAGAKGEAITLLCPDEKESLNRACAAMRQTIATIHNHPYMTPLVTKSLAGLDKPTKPNRGRRR